MGEEEREQPRLRVTDKRRFREDGEVDARSSEEKACAAQREEEGPCGVCEKAEGAEDRHGVSGAALGEVGAADFSSFIFGIYLQVMAMLGEVPDAETGKRTVNLEGARQFIDLLGMLEEKTQGNRSEREDAMLGDMLSQARLVFVRKLEQQGGKK